MFCLSSPHKKCQSSPPLDKCCKAATTKCFTAALLEISLQAPPDIETITAHNMLRQRLMLKEKILLRTLHIKLGLAKQFIKALKSDSKALSHVQAMFPKLSEAKVKGGIFTEPQIWQMLGSKELEDKMTTLERDAWQSFRNVVHGFLGRNKANNYEDCVETLLQTYCKLGCRMSLKMHYLHSYLDFSGQI